MKLRMGLIILFLLLLSTILTILAESLVDNLSILGVQSKEMSSDKRVDLLKQERLGGIIGEGVENGRVVLVFEVGVEVGILGFVSVECLVDGE